MYRKFKVGDRVELLAHVEQFNAKNKFWRGPGTVVSFWVSNWDEKEHPERIRQEHPMILFDGSQREGGFCNDQTDFYPGDGVFAEEET